MMGNLPVSKETMLSPVCAQLDFPRSHSTTALPESSKAGALALVQSLHPGPGNACPTRPEHLGESDRDSCLPDITVLGSSLGHGWYLQTNSKCKN